jgi:serine/threonine protein kinase
MHKKKIVHRDIKPDNIFMTDSYPDGKCKIGDYGTCRIVDKNDDFTPEAFEPMHTTVVGSGYFMSPEMKSEDKTSLKTDSWSLGITAACMLGLDDVCPQGYKAGIPGFAIKCAKGEHDTYLAEKGIFLSPVVKDLLKNMLTVNPTRRYSLAQINDTRLVMETDEEYTANFNKWYEKEVVPLIEKVKEDQEIVKDMTDDDKAFYMSLKKEEEKRDFLNIPDWERDCIKRQPFMMTIRRVKSQYPFRWEYINKYIRSYIKKVYDD